MDVRSQVQVPDGPHARLASESFRILADPTRVRIMWVLLQEECNVTRLAELIEASPTVVSQHLAKLRAANLVQTRRAGTFVYYSASDAHVHRLLSEVLSYAEHQSGAAHGRDPHTYTS
ncbi:MULTISPECIES: metalloregulator ArsR/SmtB family transcription factor [unclassified Brevibacterium]|uniref:ArsR/SmtB family transcription factor n=1 Tax=unclassified Brevibacterium TaxID=2614124 RepID=UPI0010C77C8B|nr:metalloregulator ArsR/SmtB family transcription factor [Brevibacterium sp. CS2]QCP04256.1 winged helix-turn-helix transcriptional regulator [Brevibacterium sp. CS2]